MNNWNKVCYCTLFNTLGSRNPEGNGAGKPNQAHVQVADIDQVVKQNRKPLFCQVNFSQTCICFKTAKIKSF